MGMSNCEETVASYMDSFLASSNSKNAILDDAGKPNALFFNYHEFSITDYAEIGQEAQEHDEDLALCITHFPNTYAPPNSVRFTSTRIVRIPRRFEESLEFPTFSTLLPGHEPAALVAAEGDLSFIPHGYFQNQLFGLSSVSPLSMHLSDEEFQEIVSTINDYLRRGYNSGTWLNAVNAILDALTFNLWNSVLIRATTDPLTELESYVEELNRSALFQERNIKVMSPRRSGYLSLDFEVPRPSL